MAALTFVAAAAAHVGHPGTAAAAACRSPLGVCAFTPAAGAQVVVSPAAVSLAAGAGRSPSPLPPMTALMPGFPTADTDSGARVGVIRTRWGGEMVDAQHAAVLAGLADAGVTGERLVEMTVPGAFEVPMAARLMGLAQKVDAMVVIGLLIEGETGHYEYISKAVMTALMEVRGSAGGSGGEGAWDGGMRWKRGMETASSSVWLMGAGVLVGELSVLSLGDGRAAAGPPRLTDFPLSSILACFL